MAELREEFKFNESLCGKIEDLSTRYVGYRSIRGDGNCYYRAVAFSFLEKAMRAGENGKTTLRSFRSLVEAANFRGNDDAAIARACVLFRIDEWIEEGKWTWRQGDDFTTVTTTDGDISKYIFATFVEDDEFDKDIILLLRHVTGAFLRTNAESLMPNGMTFEMMTTIGMGYANLAAFCTQTVEKMGEDAEGVVHMALPAATGINVRMEYLDRRAGVELKPYDFPDDGAPRSAYILIKPGHFDMLYPRDERKGRRIRKSIGCTQRTRFQR